MREQEVFNKARRITSPQQRDKFVKKQCGDDENLHHRVTSLLCAFDEQPDFLESGPAELGSVEEEPEVLEGPGSVIDAYAILDCIGEGGFGCSATTTCSL